MKCIYYLTSTLNSTSHIQNDLHRAGIDDWFIHVISKNERGLAKEKIYSSNYLEQLDVLRGSAIGAIIGFIIGLVAAWLVEIFKPFGSVPNLAYYAVVIALTLFGAWQGSIVGFSNQNKKISIFRDEIEAGKYLILLYVRKKMEDTVKSVIKTQHPEAKLVAEDEHFYNPLSELERI